MARLDRAITLIPDDSSLYNKVKVCAEWHSDAIVIIQENDQIWIDRKAVSLLIEALEEV